MSALVIVQCGGKKIWKNHPNLGSVAAKNAYTSPYFQKNKLYAEKVGDQWVVLSAKYGFLDPDDEIEDYNVTFKQKKSNPISTIELREQVKTKELDQFDEVVVLGGKEYLKATHEAFRNTDCTITSAFEGLSMGVRMSRINKELKNTF